MDELFALAAQPRDLRATGTLRREALVLAIKEGGGTPEVALDRGKNRGGSRVSRHFDPRTTNLLLPEIESLVALGDSALSAGDRAVVLELLEALVLAEFSYQVVDALPQDTKRLHELVREVAEERQYPVAGLVLRQLDLSPGELEQLLHGLDPEANPFTTAEILRQLPAAAVRSWLEGRSESHLLSIIEPASLFDETTQRIATELLIQRRPTVDWAMEAGRELRGQAFAGLEAGLLARQAIPFGPEVGAFYYRVMVRRLLGTWSEEPQWALFQEVVRDPVLARRLAEADPGVTRQPFPRIVASLVDALAGPQDWLAEILSGLSPRDNAEVCAAILSHLTDDERLELWVRKLDTEELELLARGELGGSAASLAQQELDRRRGRVTR